MARASSPILALFVVLNVLSLVIPSLALAADSALGEWKGTVETRRGANEITLDFKGTDEELQGTWTGPRGTSELQDVEYRDGTLTFVRNLEVQGRAIALQCTATIDGDTMSVTMKSPRGENRFTATRVQ